MVLICVLPQVALWGKGNVYVSKGNLRYIYAFWKHLCSFAKYIICTKAVADLRL